MTAIVEHARGPGRDRPGLQLLCPAQPGSGSTGRRLRPLYEASLHKFYVDEIYDWVVVKTTRALAVVCEFLDEYLVDRLVLAIARLPRRLGKDCWRGTRTV